MVGLVHAREKPRLEFTSLLSYEPSYYPSYEPIRTRHCYAMRGFENFK